MKTSKKMTSLILSLVLALLAVSGALAATTWQNVGPAGFSAGSAEFPSLAIYNGTPYVAYMDGGNSNKATVKKFNGSNWVNVGSPGISVGIGSTPSLAIYNGTIYVAYADSNKYFKVTVKKYTNRWGATWEDVGSPGFSAGSASYMSLAIYDGTPYVAYRDYANGNKATVMKFNGSSWVNVGSPGFSAGQADSPSLAIYNGTIYVAYRDNANGFKATVKKYTNRWGATWVDVGSPGFSAESTNWPSLAIYNGTLYVAYADGSQGNKATVMKFNGSSWVNVGSPGFSAGQADYTSLAIYTGTPYVAYSDDTNSNKATVMMFNGSNWVNVGAAGFSAGQADFTSLAIHNGNPYVAYSDGGNSSKATVMKYLTPQKLTVRSQGGYDGWVLESTETSNTGGSMNSSATTFYLGDNAQDKQYRAILHFNTAGLPDTAVITKVTLKIKKQGVVGADPFTILGGLKVDIRKPFFGTTVGLVISDFQAAAGKSAVATFNATPVSNWYSALLNATGRNYVNKTGATQLRLRFAKDDNDDLGADYMKFFSGNYATASYRPTLIIEYYVP